VVTEVIWQGNFEEYLDTKAERIVEAIRAEMQAEVVNLLSYIKDSKLSGQVLNQRSGNLKNSAFTEVENQGSQIEGTVGFGRTVPYAAIHNYGGKINVPEVDGKLMVFERAGMTVFTMRHRAFTVTMPERNYLESSLAEQEQAIMAGFESAVDEAIAD